MPVNTALLQRTLAHIEAHPEDWVQRYWSTGDRDVLPEGNVCGTACCFAGHALLLGANAELTHDSIDQLARRPAADREDARRHRQVPERTGGGRAQQGRGGRAVKGIQDAFDLLEKAAVAERGEDFLYQAEFAEAYDSQGCVYVWNGEPACLVGLALVLGDVLSTEELALQEGMSASAVTSGFFSGEACEVLRAAQMAQDQGAPWGESLQAAYDKARGLGWTP